MPDSARKSQVWRERVASAPRGTTASAIAQVNASTTVVRIAVARLELTPSTPILARTAVMPAKKAERRAQAIQVMAASSRLPCRVEQGGDQISQPDGEKADHHRADDIGSRAQPLAFLGQHQRLQAEGGEGGETAANAGHEEDAAVGA